MIKLALSIATVAAIVISSVAEEIVFKEDLVKSSKQWKASEGWMLNGDYATLEYRGKGASLEATMAVEGESYYRLSFDLRAAKADPRRTPDELTLNVTTKSPMAIYNKFRLYPDWTPGVFYFYSAQAESIVFRWAVTGPDHLEMDLRNVTLTKLNSEDLKKNMIPNGDVAEGKYIPVQWTPGGIKGQTEPILEIGDFSDFIRPGPGAILRAVPAAKDQMRRMVSDRFPITPQRRYKVSVWMKSAGPEDAMTFVSLDGWFRDPKTGKNEGKHWYRQEKFSVGTDWQEYTFDVETPSVEEYPSLISRTAHVEVGAQGSGPALYVKGISCAEIP